MGGDPLKGWILYKEDPAIVKQETYEINRLIETGAKFDVEVELVNPDHVDIIVSRTERESVWLNSVATELPDFVLPRMGSGTDYFALAVIEHLDRLGVYPLNGTDGINRNVPISSLCLNAVAGRIRGGCSAFAMRQI